MLQWKRTSCIDDPSREEESGDAIERFKKLI
jgi:hypothetical protein